MIWCFQDKRDLVVFPFVPSKEPVEGEGERFLTEHPRTLLERGAIAPVPLIIGVNDKEGMLVLNGKSRLSSESTDHSPSLLPKIEDPNLNE